MVEFEYTKLDASQLIRKHELIDNWFPFRYSLDIYSGCEFSCPFCRVNWFNRKKIIIKKNLPKLLSREIDHLPTFESGGCLVGIGGGYNEIFSPINEKNRHSDLTIESLLKKKHRPFLMTQNPGYLIEKLSAWNRFRDNTPMVIVTLPSFDFFSRKEGTDLNKLPSQREKLHLMHHLTAQGWVVGAMVMPIIPELGDDEKSLEDLFQKCKKAGAQFLMFGTIDHHGLKHLWDHDCYSSKSVEGEQVSLEKVKNLVEHRNQWKQYQKKLEQKCFSLCRKLNLFPRISLPLIEKHLSRKDLICVALGQVYYLEQMVFNLQSENLKQRPVREAFKFAAYSINQISEEKLKQLIDQDQINRLSGVGNYLALIISQMFINNDFSFYHEYWVKSGFQFFNHD